MRGLVDCSYVELLMVSARVGHVIHEHDPRPLTFACTQRLISGRYTLQTSLGRQKMEWTTDGCRGTRG